MPGGGMRWNSRLPKVGAGRPKGAVNGVRRPGINGGQTKRRSQAEREEDPLYIRGANMVPQMTYQPEFLTVEDVVKGSRLAQDILTRDEWEDRFERVFERLFEKAQGGDNKAAELLLSYRFGKPIAINASATTEVSGEDVREMAARIRALGEPDEPEELTLDV